MDSEEIKQGLPQNTHREFISSGCCRGTRLCVLFGTALCEDSALRLAKRLLDIQP